MNTYLYNGHVVTAINKKSILKKNERVVAEGRMHLKELIEEAIAKYGNKCDLNFIDVSKVTDMTLMFCNSDFNGDISKWDVSNVETMRGMFRGSKFNCDISKWDVINVIDMYRMFWESKFTGDISNWNVSNVIDMSYMFSDSKFNCNISKWIPMMKKNGINIKDLGLPPIKKDTWNDIEV